MGQQILGVVWVVLVKASITGKGLVLFIHLWVFGTETRREGIAGGAVRFQVLVRMGG